MDTARCDRTGTIAGIIQVREQKDVWKPSGHRRGKENNVREKGTLTSIHAGHRRRVPTANVLVERAGATGVSLEGNEELRKEEDVNDGPR